MDGRTKEDCDRLNAEAAADDLAADETYDPESASSYSQYLRDRAAWKRYLGSGVFRTDDE
jgi:hypothetical protein